MWDVEREANPEPFLAVAKQLGIRLVYIDGPLFSEELIQETLHRAESQDKRNIAGYETHLGLVRFVDVSFVYDEMFHRFQVVPNWYQAFLDFAEPIEEEQER